MEIYMTKQPKSRYCDDACDDVIIYDGNKERDKTIIQEIFTTDGIKEGLREVDDGYIYKTWTHEDITEMFSSEEIRRGNAKRTWKL